MARLLTILLGTTLFALLPSCAGRKAEERPPPAEPGPGDDGARKAIESAEERERIEREYGAVMYRRRLEQAKAHRNALELRKALEAVEDALRYNPTSDEALTLRSELQRQLGERRGEVETLLGDLDEKERVRMEMQKVNVRRHLDAAEKSLAARDFENARRSYEDALFIVNTAPYRADQELVDLGARAKQGLDAVARARAEAERARAAEETRQAIERIAAEEEKALLEARDRRAKLLAAAVRHFNREQFDTAQEYAAQVLAEEPDNTVARDILENSRRARHTALNRKYLAELKESYRAWTLDLERDKVLQTDVLRWPSQSFWDKITRLRAVRAVGSTGRELSPEEQNVQNLLRTRVIDLPFDKMPFPQVRDYLTAASGLNFVIDARTKDDLEAAEISIQANRVTVEDALKLIMLQASPDGNVVWEVTGNVVRFIKKEHQKRNMVLQIHPVADLVLPLTDFIPPQITQVGVSDDSDRPIFGGQAEEAPTQFGTIEELNELVKSSVAPDQWEAPATNTIQGKNLVYYNTPEVQAKVAQFLDDLRAFAGIVVTIETRFLRVSDAFLRDVGVDFRGLGGTNGGPLAVLDDVTSGLDDNASAARDNSGIGLPAGAASPPSSGLFFNDGGDGDFRGRSENIFTSPLGQMLSSLGGGTFQVTFLDDFSLSAIVRLVEKSANVRELTAPSLTVYNTQRANLTVVNQISFVQDFDVEVAQTAFIADPVIGVIQDGLTLDVRPTVSNDRQYVTMELRPTIVDLVTPIATFQTLLGASIAFVSSQSPVTIQLPELDMRIAESTVRIPDRGSILLGGLKDISTSDKKSTTPILGNLPILSFLFSRQGKSEEVRHLMIIVTATITDLQEQAARVRG
jgi:general secretion pathway protein D